MVIVYLRKDISGVMSENRFCFIAPMFNASGTLERMLHSLYGQSYDNWHLILIDDVSDKGEAHRCAEIAHLFKAFDSTKLTTIWNKEKQWEVANVLRGISMCEDEDIVCRIDADDWLCELDALAMIDQVYNHEGCDLLWTQHRWGFSDKNISGPMLPTGDPYKHPWVSSHLKTFRKRLLNGVNDQNFRGEDGNYIRRAGDQAIYLPSLHQSRKRIFLPRVVYHYTINDVPETYQTNDARFQRDEALFLRARGFVK
jgi:glycosyltransferase involved in cell wall biosynthesis